MADDGSRQDSVQSRRSFCALLCSVVWSSFFLRAIAFFLFKEKVLKMCEENAVKRLIFLKSLLIINTEICYFYVISLCNKILFLCQSSVSPDVVSMPI